MEIVDKSSKDELVSLVTDDLAHSIAEALKGAYAAAAAAAASEERFEDAPAYHVPKLGFVLVVFELGPPGTRMSYASTLDAAGTENVLGQVRSDILKGARRGD